MNNSTKNNWNFEAIASNMQKQDQEYLNSSDANKQAYWNSLFIWVFYWRTWLELPLNLNKYKETISYLENDFDRFIPWIVDALEDNGFTWNLEDIFIIDEQDKDILENIQKSSWKVKNTIQQKITQIDWINISNKELAEKVWDLFYDSLSFFISSLWEKIDNEDMSKLLREASNHIMNAWNICLPYVSHDFPEMKHTSDVKWLDIDRENLVKGISNLVDSELKDFLEKLSLKIQKDWEADKWRWRIKLANELFICANRLKEASEKI
jgi:hypothetical protein